MITFSLSSDSLSILLDTADSTNTLTVSWNEAADNHESVNNEIFVNHRSNLSQIACPFPASLNSSLIFLYLIMSTISQGKKGDSHLSKILTLLNICLTISSTCLEFTV
jgi:hypothetical protein